MKATRIYRGDVADLILPDHLADWDVWDYWECERFDSMASVLGPEDTLWVIGAEHGAMAALWARLAGDTVLVEPSPEFWPNIRKTWEANGLTAPAFTVQALVFDRFGGPTATVNALGWPECAAPDEECPARPYRYVHNEKDAAVTPQITLDGLSDLAGIPTAISIDIEGAEVLALHGATRLLTDADVHLWVSIHPDLIERDYSPHRASDVHDLLDGLGYRGVHVATDHEEHWYFSPKGTQ